MATQGQRAILVIALVAACSTGVGMPAEDPSAIGMYSKPGIGTYLVDNNGRALYAFSGDDDGHSACLTNCASVWRPVMSGKVPMAADVTVAGAKLALAMRPDSTKQVMYNRILLYYYEPDVKPGETSGHNAGSFGGRFRLVSPAGKPLVDGR